MVIILNACFIFLILVFPIVLLYKMNVYLPIVATCVWVICAVKCLEQLKLDMVLYRVKYIIFMYTF